MCLGKETDETHGLNLEMNRTVWKNFLSLLAAALVLKEFFVIGQEQT